MEKQLGTIIATRELSLTGGGRVLIEIGQQLQAEGDPLEYRCPYRITGLGRGRIRMISGVDAVQALLLALQTIGTDLYTSSEYEAGTLVWPDDRSRNLGFPVAEALRDLLPPDARRGST
jgi:hypothetical protein